MFWKKNVFSYMLWLALGAVSVSGLYGLIANMTRIYQMPLYGNLLIAIAYCMVAYAIMLLVRNLIEDKFYKVKIEEKTIRLIELLGIALCVVLGSTLRLLEINGRVSDTYYFQYARTNGGQSVPAFVHGAGYLYTLLLRGVCEIFGNDIMNAAVLQLVLYALGFLCLFFAVRILSGKMPAFAVLFVGLCATYLRRDVMVLSPTGLIFLLLAIVTLLFAVVIKKEAVFYWYLPIGLLTGLFAYLDSICFLGFFIFLAFALKEDEEYEEDIKHKLILIFSVLGMTLLGFGIMFFGDMLISGSSADRIWWAYTYANFNGDSSVLSFTLESKNVVEMTVFFATLILAFVGFALDKHKERITGWTLPVLVLLVVQALGVGNKNVDLNIFLIVFAAALCGIGVSSFWIFERLPVRQTQYIMGNGDDKPGDEEKGEKQPEAEEQKKEVKQRYSLKIDPPEGMEKEEVEFIENPLPLPKVHVSKSMDYDIEVPDDDDYDI